MKILYLSQYFPPEMGAPAARAAELARHWVEAGHEVTVLTGFPNHPTGVVPSLYRSQFRRLVTRRMWNGVKLIRTYLVNRGGTREIFGTKTPQDDAGIGDLLKGG